MYRHVLYLRRLWPVVLGLLVFSVLLLRALDWWRLSEKVSLERQLQDLESVARIRLAEAIMEGNTSKALALDGGNPFDWAQTSNRERYVGRIEVVGWEGVPPGAWAYDSSRGELVYRLVHPELVVKTYPPFDQLRWRVSVSTINERWTARQVRIRPLNVRLVPAVEFRWAE